MDEPLPTSRPVVLSVRDLVVDVATPVGGLPVVNGVSFDLHAGEVLSIVGESGSGKSVTMLALMGLLSGDTARIRSGSICLAGVDLRAINARAMQDIRGKDLAMIFQEPMTSLNPVIRVGRQIAETIRIHTPGLDRAAVDARVIELLKLVGVPNPVQRARQYPHEYSGGMRQRVMIAMAIANDPQVLIADEPTTALDVTIQAQVMQTLAAARRRTGAAMILVTHDLGLVAETADRVAVMYGGRIVETGSVDEVFGSPRHPYTIGLLRSLPSLEITHETLYAIPGQPPSVRGRAGGCVFHPRCQMRAGREACELVVPDLTPVSATQSSACHYADETIGWSATIDLDAPVATGELTS